MIRSTELRRYSFMGSRTVSRTSSSSSPTKVCSISVTWPSPGWPASPRLAVEASFSATSSSFWPSRWVSRRQPSSPACERLRVARRGDPDRQLCLNGARQGPHLDRLAGGAGKAAAFRRATGGARSSMSRASRPCDRRRLRRSTKSLGCQPDANETPTRPLRDVVDERPFLGDADRVVQRQHAAARADPQSIGDGGDRGAGHRRIGIQPAECMEVALGRPDGARSRRGRRTSRLRAAARTCRRRSLRRRWRNRTG